MNDPHSHEFLRALPSVDDVLRQPAMVALRDAHPRFPWTPFVRALLDELRAGPPAPADRAALLGGVVETASRRVGALRSGGLGRVLNGTGVVLHTNLGRAPVGERAAAAAARAMRGYVDLEIDLATGERSRRGETLAELVCWMTGAEAAMVVNNNAAAVYLTASSFSPPGRVIVSRGELVEIGGSFRLPEILRHAAAEVIEVGTTNRTYAADYEKVARAGDLLLKVHKSNYAIEGFAHEPTVAELVGVARRCGGHVAFDLGSGAFFDFAGNGIGEEPMASAIVDTGVDAVTMSADKLLGGLQAGIVAGTRAFVDVLKRNPLRRALRVDKVTIASLQEVVRAYLFARDPREEIPILGMIAGDRGAVRRRAERVAAVAAKAAGASWAVAAVADDAAVGGGSLSSVAVPSWAVSLRGADERAASRLVRAMRLLTVPLFARVRDDEVRVNMTTILASDDAEVAQAIVAALESVR
jgi:L-seryl-tRNA(Ser) seleniumtransferase